MMKTAMMMAFLVGCGGGSASGLAVPTDDSGVSGDSGDSGGAEARPAPDRGPGPVGCVPGASPSCACPSGGLGAQVCQPDGTFGPCICPDGGAPMPDAGSPDAAGDVKPAKPDRPPCVDTGLCPYGVELVRRCQTDGGIPLVNSCGPPRWCELCRIPGATDYNVCHEGAPDLGVGPGLPPTCVASCSECWEYGT